MYMQDKQKSIWQRICSFMRNLCCRGCDRDHENNNQQNDNSQQKKKTTVCITSCKNIILNLLSGLLGLGNFGTFLFILKQLLGDLCQILKREGAFAPLKLFVPPYKWYSALVIPLAATVFSLAFFASATIGAINTLEEKKYLTQSLANCRNKCISPGKIIILCAFAIPFWASNWPFNAKLNNYSAIAAYPNPYVPPNNYPLMIFKLTCFIIGSLVNAPAFDELINTLNKWCFRCNNDYKCKQKIWHGITRFVSCAITFFTDFPFFFEAYLFFKVASYTPTKILSAILALYGGIGDMIIVSETIYATIIKKTKDIYAYLKTKKCFLPSLCDLVKTTLILSIATLVGCGLMSMGKLEDKDIENVVADFIDSAEVTQACKFILKYISPPMIFLGVSLLVIGKMDKPEVNNFIDKLLCMKASKCTKKEKQGIVRIEEEEEEEEVKNEKTRLLSGNYSSFYGSDDKNKKTNPKHKNVEKKFSINQF